MRQSEKRFKQRFHREKTAASHPALEFFLAILFFLMLILTVIAFFVFSPMSPNFRL